jgi:alpha-L-fucosidase
MSLVLLDSYQGTNNELCSAHTVDLGGPFSTAFGGDPLLDGLGRIKCNFAGAAGFCSYNGTYPADVEALIPVTFLDVQSDQGFHIAPRVTPTGDRYDLIYDGSTNVLILYCYVSGSPTQIGSNVDFTPSPGVTYNFAVSCHGTTITAYKDGVSIASGTNSQISAAGWIAILLGGANTDSTGIRFGRIQAWPYGQPPAPTSTVPTTGEKINLTFAGTAIGLILADFTATADGVALPLASLTGSGTAFSLKLGPVFIGAGQVVHVTYNGTIFPTGSITATNASTVPMVIVNYNKLQFGAFITWSAATFPAAVDPVLQAAANIWFAPSHYSMKNMLDGAERMGAKYIIFTAKHGGAFCLWPTASGAPNIGPTPWYVGNGIDIVEDYVTKARARGLGVGLYINFYDSWFTTTRSGANGTYVNTGPTFTQYISEQITELLTNYGQIDYLWTDSWGYTVGYTACPYAPIRALVTSLQPNCILINNSHDAVVDKLLHSDIAVYENNEGTSPDASTIIASEFCEPSRVDDTWVWTSASEVYIDPAAAAAKLTELVSFHSNFLLNITPDDTGVIPPLQRVFIDQLGTILGVPGDSDILASGGGILMACH